jgi:hypothetical protein
MNLKIVYQPGKDANVVDTETGRAINGVTSVEWKCNRLGMPVAQITIQGIGIDSQYPRNLEAEAAQIRSFLMSQLSKGTPVHD